MVFAILNFMASIKSEAKIRAAHGKA